MLSRIPPQWIIVMTACLWSLAGVMIKSVSLGAMSVAGLRSLFAAITLGILFSEVRKIPTKFQLIGSLAYVLTVISFVQATKLTTAANAIFLQSTAPFYIFIFGWFALKQSPKRSDFIFMPLIGIGMALFFMGDLELKSLIGLLVAAGSGVFFASFLILMKKESSGSPLRAIFYGNILTFLFCIAFFEFESLNYSNLGFLAAMGVVQLALPYYLYSRAVHHISSLDASLLLLLEPILNPIWVMIAVGERPSWNATLGGLIVISTVAARSVFNREKRIVLE